MALVRQSPRTVGFGVRVTSRELPVEEPGPRKAFQADPSRLLELILGCLGYANFFVRRSRLAGRDDGGACGLGGGASERASERERECVCERERARESV